MIGQWLEVTYLEEENDYKFDYIDDELDINLSELMNIELEKRLVKKLRRGSTLLSELLIPGTEYIYKYPLRTRMEIEGGAKIALRKGARVNEVKVYNLVVRFKNKRYDNSKALAFMYRPLKNNDEWIVLQPDNTELTIDLEKHTIGLFGDDYYGMGRMTRQQKDHLEQNLNLLNIPERCAQTLIHEYGHILHWRIFDHVLGSSDSDIIYLWFLKHGYPQNIDARNPKYFNASDEKKIHFLKESLVEDYRIHLNINAKDGMFILPSKYNFAGDLCVPELLEGGIYIMQQMLKPAMENKSMFRKRETISHDELDLRNMRDIHKAALQDSWSPGQRRMLDEDHIAVYSRLAQKNAKLHVATTQ